MRVLAPVGTRKGLFPVTGNDSGDSRQVDGPQLEGWGASRIDVTDPGG